MQRFNPLTGTRAPRCWGLLGAFYLGASRPLGDTGQSEAGQLRRYGVEDRATNCMSMTFTKLLRRIWNARRPYWRYNAYWVCYPGGPHAVRKDCACRGDFHFCCGVMALYQR
jgi:hypothetical protein